MSVYDGKYCVWVLTWPQPSCEGRHHCISHRLWRTAEAYNSSVPLNVVRDWAWASVRNCGSKPERHLSCSFCSPPLRGMMALAWVKPARRKACQESSEEMVATSCNSYFALKHHTHFIQLTIEFICLFSFLKCFILISRVYFIKNKTKPPEFLV